MQKERKVNRKRRVSFYGSSYKPGGSHYACVRTINAANAVVESRQQNRDVSPFLLFCVSTIFMLVFLVCSKPDSRSHGQDTSEVTVSKKTLEVKERING